ncbi:MAG: DUF885 family protein [Candidatus Eremiobacteraeota bacterium]|nr:DUF885 family protein [Candidatus Eremiobacteraeota bacterium]
MIGALLSAAIFAAQLAAVPAPVRPSADAALTALAQAYFAYAWRDNPVQATNAGVHTYDDKLGSYSGAAYRARVSTAKSYLRALWAIDRRRLSTESNYDFAIFDSRLRAAILALQTEQNWRHHPSSYTGAASNAIFSLIKRDYAPLAVRMRAAIARERLIPGLLADGAANITTVDPTTAQIEAADIKGSIVFFRRSYRRRWQMWVIRCCNPN